MLRRQHFSQQEATRGARSGSKLMVRRLHLWRDYQWEALYTTACDKDAKEQARRARRAARAPAAHIADADDDDACEPLLHRAARLARDGYYSRAAQAMAGQLLAPSDDGW
jgi:hypothetical protein